MSNDSNNKRIVKNTFALSFRFLLTAFIGIYTSRFILINLGIDDYGIYNVVGGIIGMFAFITASLINGTQRYINFYLGTSDYEKCNDIYITSINIFIILGTLIVLVGETAGVFILNHQLKIPPDRLFAANVVLQFTLISCFLDIVSTPYNALIVAHEKMATFAYVSVIQSVSNLVFVFLLPFCPFDRLITYGFLQMLLLIGIRFFYGWYCNRNFPMFVYRMSWKSNLFKEMFSFSGWTLWGTFAVMTITQGITVLTNMFFGPAVNAAYGIVTHVNSQITNFSSNFQTASRPQITKYYAEGNVKKMENLVNMTVKVTYIIIIMLAIPIIANIDYILGVWLDVIPEYTSVFLILALVNSIINTLSSPIVTAIHSTGKIKYFQIADGVCFLMVLPLTYIAYRAGGAPYYSFISYLLVTFLNVFVRVFFYQHQITINLKDFCMNILRLMLVGLLAYATMYLYIHSFSSNILTVLTSFLISTIEICCLSWLLCLEEYEREQIKVFLMRKIKYYL